MCSWGPLVSMISAVGRAVHGDRSRAVRSESPPRHEPMTESAPIAGLAFDADYYRATYQDVRGFDATAAESHFNTHGLREGRQGASGGIREEFIQRLPTDGLILEIGPFAGPTIRGIHVRYADVLSREGLRARARSLGIDPDGVPEIHYVLNDFDLSRIDARFAAVVSSHSIEHQTDLVRHFQAVENLLEEHGRYCLIVPDKRYCFDHFLPESSIADVMTAYFRRNTVHDVGSIIEHWAMTTHNDTERHWAGDHGQPRLAESTEQLSHAIATYAADPTAYIDVHAWQFTPVSFAGIVRLLHELGLTRLRPAAIHNTPTGRNEFCAILEKTTAAAEASG
jgi:SAM-dependent methyltransferase